MADYRFFIDFYFANLSSNFFTPNTAAPLKAPVPTAVRIVGKAAARSGKKPPLCLCLLLLTVASAIGLNQIRFPFCFFYI